MNQDDSALEYLIHFTVYDTFFFTRKQEFSKSRPHA